MRAASLRLSMIPRARMLNTTWWFLALRMQALPSIHNGPAMLYERLLPYLSGRPARRAAVALPMMRIPGGMGCGASKHGVHTLVAVGSLLQLAAGSAAAARKASADAQRHAMAKPLSP